VGDVVKLKEATRTIAEVYVVDYISVQLDHSVTIGLSIEIEGFTNASVKPDHPAITFVFFNPFQFTKTILDEGLDKESNGFKQLVEGLDGVFVSKSSIILESFRKRWLETTPELDSPEFMHFIIYLDGESISIISKEKPKVLFAKSNVEKLFPVKKE